MEAMQTTECVRWENTKLIETQIAVKISKYELSNIIASALLQVNKARYMLEN